jgi:adenosine deaminase
MRGDEAVTQLIRNRGITLEMCPISNMQTKATTGWLEYPLRDYFDSGIRVSVATDNLTVSHTTITKEYEMLRMHLGFNDRELCAIVMNGAEAAFLEEGAKRALCEELAAQLEAWLAKEADGAAPSA